MPTAAAQTPLPAGAAPAASLRWTRSGQAVPWAEVPDLTCDAFCAACHAGCASGGRIAALCLFPHPTGTEKAGEQILVVLADDASGRLGLAKMLVPASRAYPSLSAALPQAQAFERELLELHGIRPEGHPWLKPLRRHANLDARAGRAPAGNHPHPFFKVEGPAIHEVAVGPVHAGIIEPGHFRFQCHGETVLSLEIQLGYQHRGAEALLLRSPPARRLVIAESIAGDTCVGHALAYTEAMEALAGIAAPLQAQALRGIALELERLANHVGDLGALCNDVGYLPGASWFGRLRGEFLNLLMEISGSRFGRSLIQPGGVRFHVTAAQRSALSGRLAQAGRDVRDTAEQTLKTPSVAARFDNTGVVASEVAHSLGLVGPVARASGCDRDVRRDHPLGLFRFAHIPVALVESGDVMARALVRWIEAKRSLAFVREQLDKLCDDPIAVELPRLRPDSLAVAMVEGWRGEIVHLALSGNQGQLSGYKIVDPSFHNWLGLAMALRGEQISDFPLCNKSFNLSYAGHDL